MSWRVSDDRWNRYLWDKWRRKRRSEVQNETWAIIIYGDYKLSLPLTA